MFCEHLDLKNMYIYIYIYIHTFKKYIVRCQDFHHFWLYSLVPHQADLSSFGSQAREVFLQRGGICPTLPK